MKRIDLEVESEKLTKNINKKRGKGTENQQ